MGGRIKIFIFCLLSLVVFSYSMLLMGQNSGNIETAFVSVEKDIPVLIIDAGHGGSDGGAVGVDGTEEAPLNLAISKKLNDILSVIGFQTAMTRTDENSIGEKGASIRNEKVSDIHKRMDIMNSFENCIFLSIHQNMYSGSSSSGAQVFYSPNNPKSEPIAESIQNSIVSFIQQSNHRKIKKSGDSIYLLYRALKPAVMVECGFISNSDELNKLKDENYQKEFSCCVAGGIIDYLTEKSD